MYQRICLNCNNKFITSIKTRKLCCRKCADNFRTGKKRPPEVGKKVSETRIKKHIVHSPEVIEKIRQKMIGKKRSGDPKNWKHSEESKRKMSLAQRGEKSIQWKGGLSGLNKLLRRSLHYRNWRKSVFERDNYTCVWCGANKKYLNADHIKQYALIIKENKISNYDEAIACDELWQINNGRTLCIDCHKETDTYLNKGKKYGNVDTTM